MPSLNELLDIFGKDDLLPVFEAKVYEASAAFVSCQRFTSAQREYLMAKFGAPARFYIANGEDQKKAGRKAVLAYWSSLYTKCLPDRGETSDRSERFTDEHIQRAREYPTHELYEGRLIRSGRHFKCLCPFHDERTPSFVFYEGGSYHCFGCGAHGFTAIDYLMYHDKYRFPDAVRRLV